MEENFRKLHTIDKLTQLSKAYVSHDRLPDIQQRPREVKPNKQAYSELKKRKESVPKDRKSIANAILDDSYFGTERPRNNHRQSFDRHDVNQMSMSTVMSHAPSTQSLAAAPGQVYEASVSKAEKQTRPESDASPDHTGEYQLDIKIKQEEK